MLTRAQNGLIVIGNEKTLRNDVTWANWIQWIYDHKLVIGIKTFC